MTAPQRPARTTPAGIPPPPFGINEGQPASGPVLTSVPAGTITGPATYRLSGNVGTIRFTAKGTAAAWIYVTSADPNNPATRFFSCTPEAIAGRPGAFQCAANSTPFSIPGEFEFGSAAQFSSAFRNPPVFTENISIVKTFKFTGDGRVRFVYRADFFNLFNRTNFGVNGAIGNADFGKATGPQQGARIITMGGRLEF